MRGGPALGFDFWQSYIRFRHPEIHELGDDRDHVSQTARQAEGSRFSNTGAAHLGVPASQLICRKTKGLGRSTLSSGS